MLSGTARRQALTPQMTKLASRCMSAPQVSTTEVATVVATPWKPVGAKVSGIVARMKRRLASRPAASITTLLINQTCSINRDL